MPENRQVESNEWVQQLANSWVAVYKKSLTTLVLLELLQTHGPATVSTIREHFIQRTNWTITERGLYRTLKRLADADLLAVDKLPSLGPGAARKTFTLTEAGQLYLELITKEQIQ